MIMQPLFITNTNKNKYNSIVSNKCSTLTLNTNIVLGKNKSCTLSLVEANIIRCSPNIFAYGNNKKNKFKFPWCNNLLVDQTNTYSNFVCEFPERLYSLGQFQRQFFV